MNTNFGALTSEQYTVWSRTFWKEARNKTFLMAFAGDSANSMVQRITELKDSTDGARAVITLVNDATGDGVVGDNTLKGNEEALKSSEAVITMDQWRHAHTNTGKMSDQRSIVNFRGEAKDNLANTAARVMDELMFLTLSGVSYTQKPDGAARVGSQLPNLTYASAVSAPSSKRHVRWTAASGGSLQQGDTTQITAADVPTYNMLLDLKARAVNSFIRPIRTDDGVEVYNVFMTPDGIAKLKKDQGFRDAVKDAGVRGGDNVLFKGTKHGGRNGIVLDGLNILEYRHVYNTRGAIVKWGAGNAIDGQRVLLCGAQALAFADIGTAEWKEEMEDYDNITGIGIAKIFGLLKPKLFSTAHQSVQDFGVLVCDTAL